MFCKKFLLHVPRQVSRLPNARMTSNANVINESVKVEKTLNQIMLLGRVGADPQKRGTEAHPVVLFSIATHTNYKYETGEFMQRTDWHRICVFKPTLRDSVYNYMKKGQRVLVNGRLSYGEIKDEQGNPKTTTSIIADDVIFFQAT